MTNVKFSRAEFEKRLGRKISKEIEDKISMFGTPLESINESEIVVEIFPNRPDLIPLQNYVRAFRAFLGKDAGVKIYKIEKAEKNYKVKVIPSVKKVRPFTACSIVKGLSLDEGKIKQLIDIQEKLHGTIGRNRRKAAIGIYPLDKVSLPIKYEARAPEKIKFVPLGESREMSAAQILNRHPAGKEYSHLLDHEEVFPIFVDAKNKILSMPPIINSDETGKISESTKEVFVECSGSHFPTLKKTLNIIVAAMVEMGGKVYSMTIEQGGKKFVSPDLTAERSSLSVDNVNRILGLELKERDVAKLLARMGHDYRRGVVFTPAWRTDILHEIDLIEEVAIAYGYDKFKPELPNISTTGEESRFEKFKRSLRDCLLGLGLLEVSSYHLIKKEEAKIFGVKNAIELESSKTDYKILRPNLLIPALRILSENKDRDYPQEIFEIGAAFSRNPKRETGVEETEKLCVAVSPGNFTKVKQILDYLGESFDLEFELKEGKVGALIEGRTGRIFFYGKEVGFLGEVHPETLKSWLIKMPLAVLEISIGEIFRKSYPK